MDNLTIFKRQERKYKGTLVLEHFDVVLFVGMKYDDPEDYYYILQKDRESKTYLCSGVARIVFLKEDLKEDDYDYLARVWNYNNVSQAI